ncbi:FAD-binding domain-containing protein [Delitschia confertaspora ATCC 74209]|uniref:FAD-binding domain-containing protein n=1 Tax=Delitschia confertaspora ATCC 74209 TaxID=1513339 RepID=A0A9P4JTQ6_9PLEO|nr:FAD-binding domain-containing protein [Delitschia confertaspora ATCC 74209]
MSNNPASQRAGCFIEDSDAFDTALRRWTLYRTKTAAAVVQVACGEDFITTVRFATQRQIPLVVKSGGHSNGYPSISKNNIVVDLLFTRNVSVDVEKGITVADRGVATGDGIKAAGKVGGEIATGTCNAVALISATLGGGVGPFLDLRGYNVGIIPSVRAVVVDSSPGATHVLVAPPECNPGLFWTLRGTGHLCGIATEATFVACPWPHLMCHSNFVFQPGHAPLVAKTMGKRVWKGSTGGRIVFCSPPPEKKTQVLSPLWYMGASKEAPSRFVYLLALSRFVHLRRLPYQEHSPPFDSVGHTRSYLNLNDSSAHICAYEGRKTLSAFRMHLLPASACASALEWYRYFLTHNPHSATTHMLIEIYSMNADRKSYPDGTNTAVSKGFRNVECGAIPFAWYDIEDLDEVCKQFASVIKETLLQGDDTRLGRAAYLNTPGKSEDAANVFGNDIPMDKS